MLFNKLSSFLGSNFGFFFRDCSRYLEDLWVEFFNSFRRAAKSCCLQSFGVPENHYCTRTRKMESMSQGWFLVVLIVKALTAWWVWGSCALGLWESSEPWLLSHSTCMLIFIHPVNCTLRQSLCFVMRISIHSVIHCTALHYTTLHCTALHCTALHFSVIVPPIYVSPSTWLPIASLFLISFIYNNFERISSKQTVLTDLT